jgi:hypothetical protein
LQFSAFALSGLGLTTAGDSNKKKSIESIALIKNDADRAELPDRKTAPESIR